MITWSNDELRKIAEADELLISPLREDGVRYRTLTPIWSVAVADALYVRAYNGQNSRWYQAAIRPEGREDRGRRCDEGSQLRARRGLDQSTSSMMLTARNTGSSPYVGQMIDAGVRSATVKVTPRASDAG